METIKKEPLKISISTQKGGVGKSTMTTLLASVLHYRLGYNVLVMDCDFPQFSISKMRDRDKKNVMKNEHHQRAALQQFQTINKKAYPIVRSKAGQALEMASAHINKSPFQVDIVFFDLPGTANTPGVLTTLRAMDFIFLPMAADRFVVESTLSFAKAFMNLPETGDSNLKTVMQFYWNQVDGREKTDLYDSYEKVIKLLNFSIMVTRLMDSKRFRKESESGFSIFRSTLFPAAPRLMKTTRLDKFLQEFLKITNL